MVRVSDLVMGYGLGLGSTGYIEAIVLTSVIWNRDNQLVNKRFFNYNKYG